jgi:hypothetical protein
VKLGRNHPLVAFAEDRLLKDPMGWDYTTCDTQGTRDRADYPGLTLQGSKEEHITHHVAQLNGFRLSWFASRRLLKAITIQQFKVAQNKALDRSDRLLTDTKTNEETAHEHGTERHRDRRGRFV